MKQEINFWIRILSKSLFGKKYKILNFLIAYAAGQMWYVKIKYNRTV